MREIKFRCWTGIMQYDIMIGRFGLFYVNPGEKGDGLDPKDTGSLTTFTTKIDEQYNPVMQFTGLIDKNGKEIFEGDIVEWDDGSNGRWRRRCEIKWEKTKFILVGYYYDANIQDSKKTPIDFKFGSFIYEYDGALEIIGNIHENPDLLTNN